MKTIIEIDLDSVVKNEREGATQTFVAGNPECELTVKFPLMDEKRFEQVRKFLEEKHEAISLQWSVGSEPFSYSHAPIPRWSYQYRDSQMIDCGECTGRFPMSMWEYDSEEETMECPNCNHQLDYEYEQIEECVKKYGLDD